jgi:K+-sensing histidine kinase KdpD
LNNSKEYQALLEENKLLKEALEIRTKFLSATIHDLSGPLTIANFEIQRAQEESGEDQVKILKNIEGSLDKMVEMIASYKKTRESFKEVGSLQVTSLKKCKEFIKFYLSQEILLNDIKIEFINENIEFKVDENFFFKSILKPILKDVFIELNNTTVKIEVIDNSSYIELVIHESCKTNPKEVEQFKSNLSEMHATLDVESDGKIIFDLMA